MANFMKDLKIVNSIPNMVMITDDNHVIKSSNLNVNNIATMDNISNIENRLDNLENFTTDVGQRLQNING